MSNAVCNTVTQRVSYNVRLSSRPDQTRPESLYRSLVVVSGSTSIDLTVGVESPPEAWMDLDDLNLLDDGSRHARCPTCQPAPLLVPFVALCGRRAMYTYRRTHTERGTHPPNACDDCAAKIGKPCATCGRVVVMPR